MSYILISTVAASARVTVSDGLMPCESPKITPVFLRYFTASTAYSEIFPASGNLEMSPGSQILNRYKAYICMKGPSYFLL